MSNSKNDRSELKGVPEPDVRTKKRGFSIVWLVPLVALAIGGWLVYKAVSEKGPVVTITFKSADGLEAGKTKIKYKDVELGVVNSIVLSKDLSQVIVTAELVKQAENFISQNTRFWVVRARVAAGGVSDSAPFFQGPTSDLIPANPANWQRNFKGLGNPAGGDHRSAGQPFCVAGLESGIAEHWRSGILPADRGRSDGQIQTGRRRAGCDHRGIRP